MKQGPVDIIPVIPAGKKPKLKKPTQVKTLYRKIIKWFRVKKMHWAYFAAGTSLAIVMLLVFHSYMSNYVYVVKLNDEEIGIVDDAREIESFIAELTARCGELYGMKTDVADSIILVREYRPNSKTDSEKVQALIRQQLNLKTDAYMITVDGVPLVPVNSEKDLDLVVEYLKEAYDRNQRGVIVLHAYIVEDLDLEKCSVDPEDVLKAEEVISLLTEGEKVQTYQSAIIPDYNNRFDSSDHYQPAGFNEIKPLLYALADSEASSGIKDNNSAANNSVHVKTIEEVTIVEFIPFTTEYVFSDEMWVVQKEIDIPGEEGRKELVYHIIRENGVEIERIRVRETILEEPVTQVELHGTIKVPSVGTGQFIWPVENGGGVTPGRGFSSWHTGIDIHAPNGTNVLAADSGVVWFSGRGGSQGNYLIIYHGSFWTLYLHNSANLVSQGDEVSQGDIIARVGSTGRSTGPHLHFEVRLDDGTGEWHTYYQHKPIDPLRFFKP